MQEKSIKTRIKTFSVNNFFSFSSSFFVKFLKVLKVADKLIIKFVIGGDKKDNERFASFNLSQFAPNLIEYNMLWMYVECCVFTFFRLNKMWAKVEMAIWVTIIRTWIDCLHKFDFSLGGWNYNYLGKLSHWIECRTRCQTKFCSVYCIIIKTTMKLIIYRLSDNPFKWKRPCRIEFWEKGN